MDDKRLLELWRQASRHVELPVATANVIATLQTSMKLSEFRLYELGNSASATLFLKLDWRGGSTVNALHHSVAINNADYFALHAWLEKGEDQVITDTSAKPAYFDAVTAKSESAAHYLAALTTSGGQRWLLVIKSLSQKIDPATRALLQNVLQPLTVMIDNDQRLREMQQLRAAAEAERDALLSRIGRASLSSEKIIGADAGLSGVMKRVRQVAPTDASALLLGETGSGKEVIARAIHEYSPRCDAPFVRVNCGALPADLIDSELFGHEKGSFTGATAVRRGWFERADGGTLFLDEIAELTLPAQVRLLRVLQDGIIQRVGGEKSIEVNVRVIAATHRDLTTMVRNGQFREDLWYRLAIFPIILPPLNERPDDIRPLALHFIHRAAQKMGVPTPPLEHADVIRLKAYSWPGNVRELSAVLERAVILGHGSYLDLENALGGQLLAKPAPTTPEPQLHNDHIATLDEAIVSHIMRALTKTHGRVDGKYGAAALLQVNPNTLRGKCRKYGINTTQFKS